MAKILGSGNSGESWPPQFALGLNLLFNNFGLSFYDRLKAQTSSENYKLGITMSVFECILQLYMAHTLAANIFSQVFLFLSWHWLILHQAPKQKPVMYGLQKWTSWCPSGVKLLGKLRSCVNYLLSKFQPFGRTTSAYSPFLCDCRVDLYSIQDEHIFPPHLISKAPTYPLFFSNKLYP